MDIKEECIKFGDWIGKSDFHFYFNGHEYQWANSIRQEYHTTESLYEKYINELNNKDNGK
jgi:hypothetical protein